jgi:hypothetical protein
MVGNLRAMANEPKALSAKIFLPGCPILAQDHFTKRPGLDVMQVGAPPLNVIGRGVALGRIRFGRKCRSALDKSSLATAGAVLCASSKSVKEAVGMYPAEEETAAE